MLENDDYRKLSGLSDISAMVLLSPNTTTSNTTTAAEKGSPEWYRMISKKLKSTIPVKDHSHFLKKYRNCFSGEACVSWLLGGEYANDASEAVEIVQTLIKMEVCV